jgi:hypothetical protein
MFRASIGQLAEYPRSYDYCVSVELSCPRPNHILGEPVFVHYQYRHDDDVYQPWQPLGPSSVETQIVSSPTKADGSAVKQRAAAMTRSLPHSSTDWMGLFEVFQDEEGRCYDAKLAGTFSDDGRGCLNERLDLGEGNGSDRKYTEKLIAWTVVPEANAGVVTFGGAPVHPGTYRVRYFLSGSQASTGTVLQLQSAFVKCELHVPSEIFIGETLPVRYALNYQETSGRTSVDWVGLYVIPEAENVASRVVRCVFGLDSSRNGG